MAVRTIDDAKLTAIADAVREQLASDVTMTPEEMPGRIRDIGLGDVPDYWRSYLDGRAAEIDAVLSAAGDNRSAFLWYTDAHWTSNYGRSPMMLKYLSRHTGMKKTFFGGDIANSKSGEMDVLTAWQGLVEGVPNHHSVIGNHDNQVSELTDAAEKTEFFFGPERTGDMVFGTDATNGKMYYYIDNHIEKTRYICLSTGRMWTYKDEIEWCVEALKGVASGWHVVVISHLWLNNDYEGGGLLTTPEDYTQVYLDLFDAYNYRMSGTTSLNSVAYDFTGAAGKIEFVIGGHVHQDYDFATAKGIPVILTECDAYQERDDVSVATQGTTTENCVYAIVADYAAKKVHVISVGRGDTRSLDIPDVATYTNQLPLAVDETGAVYNGIGYKPNTRISVSSGSFEDKTESGWYTTGYIKATKGDVIRFKNCEFYGTHTGTGTNRSFVFGSDANFAFSGSAYQAANSEIIVAANGWNAVVDENNNIVQITMPSYMTCTYVRIVMHGLSEQSIITVNEEIG